MGCTEVAGAGGSVDGGDKEGFEGRERKERRWSRQRERGVDNVALCSVLGSRHVM